MLLLEIMDAIQSLLSRVSPLQIGEPAPPPEVVATALQAALRAPDHGRLRPWHFLLIQGEQRQRFGDRLAEALRRRDPSASDGMVERERAKPLRSPLIVAVAAKVREHKTVPEIEQVLSAGAAAQNIMLALHAAGYGAVWKTGPMAYDPEVKAMLGLAPTDHLIAFIYVGTVARPAAPPPTAEPSDFVTVWSEQAAAG